MCDLKSGKGRCSYHIKESLVALESSENKEVLRAAKEAGVEIPPAPTSFDDTQEARIKELTRNDPKVAKAKKDTLEANRARNREMTEYDAVLKMGEAPIVASHLYKTSDEGRDIQSKMLAVKNDYAKNMSAIMETPGMKSHVAIQETMLAAEKKAELSRQKMELTNALKTSRESQKTFAKTFLERDVKAHQEAKDAYHKSTYDNVVALNNISVLKAKANNEKASLLRKGTRAKAKATMLAQHALSDYNGQTFRFQSGPMAGKLPEGLARVDSELKAAQENQKGALAGAEKRAMQKVALEEQSKTPEFQKFRKYRFDQSGRGKEYHRKVGDLKRDYMMTKEFRDAAEKKVDSM